MAPAGVGRGTYMPDYYGIDPKNVERYRKVRDRHQRGSTEGERQAAGAIMAQMRARYPLIDMAADEADQAETDAAAAAASGMPEDQPAHPAGGRPAWMSAGLDWLRSAAEEAAARAAVPFIASARGSVRVRTSHVVVTVHIPIEEMEDAFASPTARALPTAFAKGISGQVGEIAAEAFRVWLYAGRG